MNIKSCVIFSNESSSLANRVVSHLCEKNPCDAQLIHKLESILTNMIENNCLIREECERILRDASLS